MVNSKGVVYSVVVVVCMVMVYSVLPVVQGKAVAKASEGPSGFDFTHFLMPPLPSEDCVGVVSAPGGGSTLVPDPNDCTKYSVCTDTFSTKITCPPGQHFSVVDNRCTAPEDAGCDPGMHISC
ncbi:hypothetical protein HPB49_014932 [Dermacentor silvarum]|uniref:Uncharacterized protein n=1 Tax=Dermacentor silvarum TaxID=543639 RepID=A0ACB8D6E4_DERSI|nr:hypothetical protein HPB49_014932 [Dermacentor silvarum]